MIVKCKICAHDSAPVFQGRIFDRMVQFYECHHCDFIQSETPDWLDKAYANVINDVDTGLVARCLGNVRLVASTLLFIGKPRGRTIDYAGGYGLLTRLLRDLGVNAWWTDPYCENILAKGFEDREGSADLVTAFEAFEHFVDPMTELKHMLTIAPVVLFSTSLCPKPHPPLDKWDYYGFDHGQHISFYRVKTLKVMAEILGCEAVTDGDTRHLIARKLRHRALWPTMVRLKLPRIGKLIMGRLLTSLTWVDSNQLKRS